MRLTNNFISPMLSFERQRSPYDSSGSPIGKPELHTDHSDQLQAPDDDQTPDGPPEERERVDQPEDAPEQYRDPEIENGSQRLRQRSIGHLATDVAVTAAASDVQIEPQAQQLQGTLPVAPRQETPTQGKEIKDVPRGIEPERQPVKGEESTSRTPPDEGSKEVDDGAPKLPEGRGEGEQDEKAADIEEQGVPAPPGQPPTTPPDQPPDELEPRPDKPHFPNHIARLEDVASKGVGVRGVIVMRAGLEVETIFREPAYIKALQEKIDPDDPRQADLAQVRNPEVLTEGSEVSEETLQAFRAAARAQIEALQPQNEAEEQKKEAWLKQFEDEKNFGPTAQINWQIYNEFSRPTLGNTAAPHGTLAELDRFAERQGWLEFRFGTGEEGWQDVNKSEIRFTPCSPTELLQRRNIVLNRIDALATANNLAVVDQRRQFEHVNLSAYAPDAEGNMQPLIGHGADRQNATLDIAAGVAVAYQTGLHFDPYLTGSAENFNRFVVARDMRMGPTRGSVRIVEDRVEGRSVPDSEQSLAMLMAAVVYGLETGAAAIQKKGYQVPEVESVLRVHRTPDFDPNRDVEILNGLEAIEPADEGGFRLDPVYNALRGAHLFATLTGGGPPSNPEASAAINSIFFKAMRLDSEGIPYIDRDALVGVYPDTEGRLFKLMAPMINRRLRVVRLTQTTAIRGDILYRGETPQQAAEQLRSSEIAALALNGEEGQEEFINWLGLKDRP